MQTIEYIFPFMKNLSLIINGVLVVAVAVLFYLHFSGAEEEKVSMVSDSTVVNAKGKAVVFIDTDSLTKNFEFSKINSADLENKRKNMAAQLSVKQSAFESKYKEYMEKGANLTVSERAKVEEDLNNMKLDLDQLAYDLQTKLTQEQAVLNDSLYTMVQGFLKDYAKANGHTYILQYTPGISPILYGDSLLNITADVVNKMNAQYKLDQQKRKEEEGDDKGKKGKK